VLKQAELGVPLAEATRQVASSEQTFDRCIWVHDPPPPISENQGE
jgi:hypothetical protein